MLDSFVKSSEGLQHCNWVFTLTFYESISEMFNLRCTTKKMKQNPKNYTKRQPDKAAVSEPIADRSNYLSGAFNKWKIHQPETCEISRKNGAK